ncbi:hypothetical protein DCO44_09895 [Acinetobacter sp. AM]|nr:hypothetical protein DCO44_09895 [Acinetobacter sp. AM]
MCDAPSTSVEHVPPKCLFPDPKDLSPEEQSLDFKKQLITVPACHEHNGKKSTDDEYLFCLLAISLISGKNGQQQGITKVKRILERKPALKTKVLEKATPVIVKDTETGQIDRTIALEIDHNRINSSMESCARALFFKEFGQRFIGDVRISNHFLMDFDPQYNEKVDQLRQIADELFKNIEPKGENPTIFTYKFRIDEKNPNNLLLEMVFYEGARAVAIFEGTQTKA